MFRQITESVYASPQIGTEAIAEAKALGVVRIINNRPEGESDDQTPGAEIEAAARAAGLDYVAIPVSHAGFSEAQVDAMSEALATAEGPVLAYCRSGTRSTNRGAMTDTATEPPRAHARIVYLGPVSPHWEVYGDYGDRTLLDEFRARVLARLVLLPRDDPQFRRNRERIVRDAERERISLEWDLGLPPDADA